MARRDLTSGDVFLGSRYSKTPNADVAHGILVHGSIPTQASFARVTHTAAAGFYTVGSFQACGLVPSGPIIRDILVNASDRRCARFGTRIHVRRFCRTVRYTQTTVK